MKKGISAIVLILLVIAAIVMFGKDSGKTPVNNDKNASTTDSAKVSETVKVSSQTSEYQNAELGFSVRYPTAWERGETDLGVTFTMPIDKAQVSTVGKIQADINVSSGKCAFPPVTTVKDRGTITVGGETLNTISISNTVQGRNYFNRMYSLQKGSICYMFIFSSITLDAASKGLSGSNLTQAQNNNKAIVNTGDTAFIDMVKSFKFVTGPQGVDETKAPK